MNAYGGRPNPGGRSDGFSLFELLVVMFIVGILSALVMPRMAATMPGVQLKATARAVAASLRYARSKAVYESTPYIALFDGTQKKIAVVSMEKEMDMTQLAGLREILSRPKLQKVYEFPQGIEFEVTGHDDADLVPILFYPRGDSTGGKIVVKGVRRKPYTITVDTIMGTVKIDRE